MLHNLCLPTGKKTVCTDPELLQRELQHLRKALGRCNYPPLSINKVQNKVLNSNQDDHSNNNLQNTSNNTTNSLEQQTQTGENNSNQTQANNNQGESTTTTTSSRPNSTVGQVVIPYTKGLAESFKHTCGKYGTQVHFKGNTTIEQVLMKPKDQDPKEKKGMVIYSFQCNHIACNEEYIGKQQEPLVKDARNTPNNPLLSMCMYNKQDTALQTPASTS